MVISGHKPKKPVRKSAIAPVMKQYIVLADFSHAGKILTKGTILTISERAAKYDLLANRLGVYVPPAVAAVEAPTAPIIGPVKPADATN